MEESKMRRTPRQGDEPLSLTPLIDVSFLMLIFFMCLPFKGLDFKLQSQLPPEGPNAWRADPKEPVRIRVRRHGDEYVYALGQNAAPSAEGLKPVLRALGPSYVYEIEAGPAVPWQGVVDAVNVLASVQCTDVRFRGCPPPTREIRRR
jgi:biopolymer transport protein ExbD